MSIDRPPSPDRAVRKRKGLIATIVTTLGFMGLVLFFMMVNYERHPKVVLPFAFAKIEDRLFCIPKEYLASPQYDMNGFRIGMMLPDLHAVNRRVERAVGVHYVLVLGEPIATYVPYDEVYRRSVQTFHATREVGKVYGLKSLRDSSFRPREVIEFTWGQIEKEKSKKYSIISAY